MENECSPNAFVVAALKGCENIKQTLRIYHPNQNYFFTETNSEYNRITYILR